MSTTIDQGRNYGRRVGPQVISIGPRTGYTRYGNRVFVPEITPFPSVESPPRENYKHLDTTSQMSTDSAIDSPTTKTASKLHRRRSIIRDFSLNTSTHGLPGIARSESSHNRIFWSISFVIFLAIMVYFVVTAMLNYFSYPTQMDINVIREWPQYFPAVSICNSAIFRYDQVIEPFLNYTIAHNLTGYNDTTTMTFLQVMTLGEFVIDKMNSNESVLPYFYSLPSMLYKCTYNSVPCSSADFIPFFSATYGQCFTFNAKMKDGSAEQVRYGNQYGGDGDLELELYTHSHQYPPNYWNGNGIVALVHDNRQIPLIEASGIQLSPGTKHKLGFKKKTTFLLPPPYTQCTDNIPLSMKVMLNNYYAGADYGYSQTICLQLCEQAYAYKQCGCISPYAWNARSILLPGTSNVILAPVCHPFNLCCTQAVTTILSSPPLQNEYCSDCSQQCSITDFIVQTSGLATPMGWQYNDIKTFVENSTVPLTLNWSTNWRSDIQNNYLVLSVIRETTIVENQTQTAQLGVVDILSNIGGQTGLWIGISFLSIMEFIEMLYRIIRYQCHLVRQAIRRNN